MRKSSSKWKKFLLSFGAVVFFANAGFGQENKDLSPFKFSAFLDLYYGYDFNEPVDKKRLPFLYNHTRHSSPAINLALISGSFEKNRFRANLALQQGTYVEDNYANEPKALRWIHQANLGMALNPEKTIWLDAGVMPSHIGFETAISKDNQTLSRSLIAENSPYFETGVKLSWEKSESWSFAFLYLNGWQRIQSIPGKNNPSFGTQATYKPNNKTTLNWSTFLGTDQGIEAGTMLYFSNMYGNFYFGERWKITAGIDVGKRTNVYSQDQNWWGGALIAQYRFSENFSGSLRGEYYDDPFQAIATSNTNLGVETEGLSLNLDRKIGRWSVIRVEGRWLDSPVPFEQGFSPPKSEDMFILASWAIFWN